jgi:hypothetical protein
MTKLQESDTKGRGPTPSASAVMAYLHGPGRPRASAIDFFSSARVKLRTISSAIDFEEKSSAIDFEKSSAIDF